MKHAFSKDYILPQSDLVIHERIINKAEIIYSPAILAFRVFYILMVIYAMIANAAILCLLVGICFILDYVISPKIDDIINSCFCKTIRGNREIAFKDLKDASYYYGTDYCLTVLNKISDYNEIADYVEKLRNTRAIKFGDYVIICDMWSNLNHQKNKKKEMETYEESCKKLHGFENIS